MARTEYAKLRSPIHECKTFVAASGKYIAGEVTTVGDMFVYPLETATGATATVAYRIPWAVVPKVSEETWVPGEKTYFNTEYASFSNTDAEGDLTPVGLILEAAASGTTDGTISFIGAQVPDTTLDVTP